MSRTTLIERMKLEVPETRAFYRIGHGASATPGHVIP